MGLTIAVTRKKCNICKSKRSQRYCLRNGKDICWICCNSKRISRDCPRECQYILKDTEDQTNHNIQAKCDSYNELINLHKLAIDRWIEIPEPQFDNQIPSQLVTTDEGKHKLQTYLESIPQHHPQIINYIRRKLKLPLKPISYNHFEDIAMRYLNKIIEQEWEETVEMMFDNKRYYDHDLYKENYLNRRSGNRILKKMNDYHIILSAISEKGDEALVYFEINGKYDLSINLIKQNDDWKVYFIMMGNPQFYYTLNELENQIVKYLSEKQYDEAYDKLRKVSEILVDSAEIFFLYGLYYSIKEDYRQARKMFLTAVEILPSSYDYRYNLAFTSQVSGEINLAKDMYRELLQEKPDDLKILNNLAVIHLNNKEINSAIAIWEKCLTIDSSFELAKKNLDRFSKLISTKTTS